MSWDYRGRDGGNTELERRAIHEDAERRLRASTSGTKESSPSDHDDESHRFARGVVWGTLAALVVGSLVFFLVAASTADFVLAVGAALATVLVIAGAAWVRRPRT